MKSLFFKSSVTLILLILFTFLQSFNADKEVFSAKVSWMENTYDFGEIEKGIPVSYNFEFKNTGNEPLLISNVKTTCGCTVPAYPKEPISPGASETIKVTYNAAKQGKFNKKVSVYTNAEEEMYALTISGEVIAK